MTQIPYAVSGQIFHTSTDGYGWLEVRARNLTSGETTTARTNSLGQYVLDLANWESGYSDGDTYKVEAYIDNDNFMLTDVKIDSISIGQYLREYQVKRTYGHQIAVFESIVVNKIIDLVSDLRTGHQIEVWRGWATDNYVVQSSTLTVDIDIGWQDVDDMTATNTKIFDGWVEIYKKEGGHFRINGFDKLREAATKQVTATYLDSGPQAGKISEIFKDLITTYAGLTADSTTVQDSGTTITIKKFVCDNRTIMEACRKLANAINWQFYYRADTNKVYFEPKGYTENSNILTIGTNVKHVPRWEDNNSKMINKVTVRGESVEPEATELESGDGSTTEFTLDWVPNNVKVYLAGTLQEGGSEEASRSSVDYYIDRVNQKIIFVVAPPVAVDNVEIRYSYFKPVCAVVRRNQASIDLYGEHHTIFTLSDLKGAADAETRAIKVLERYAYPFKTSIIRVVDFKDTLGLDVGQKIRVIDSYSDIDSMFVISKFIIHYPNKFNILNIGELSAMSGDIEWVLQDRLKRLEEQMFENQDLLRNVQDLKTDAKFKRKSLTIQTRDVQDSFVLGDSTRAILGTSALGDRRTTAQTVYYREY